FSLSPSLSVHFVFFEKQRDAGHQAVFDGEAEEGFGGFLGRLEAAVLGAVDGKRVADLVGLVGLVLLPLGRLLDDERAVVGHVGGDVTLLAGRHVDEAEAAEGAVLFVVEQGLGDEPTRKGVQAKGLHTGSLSSRWLGDRPTYKAHLALRFPRPGRGWKFEARKSKSGGPKS